MKNLKKTPIINPITNPPIVYTRTAYNVETKDFIESASTAKY